MGSSHSVMAPSYQCNTHHRAVFLLLYEGEHAGEDAGTHDQVSLLLHVGLEDPEHHGQQDASRLCNTKESSDITEVLFGFAVTLN